ncbi:MAG TPA: hypothetical protein VF624_18920 [Tepidisphaeraceae bacterium]
MNTRTSLLLLACAAAAGCTSGQPPVAAVPSTQTATDADPATAEPAYWLAKPAVDSVSGEDFDALWDASARVARDLLFQLDRQDRRSGMLTTLPMVSAQFFEPWRRELQDAAELRKSSVATLRRTLHFTIDRAGSGYVVTPRVIVERQAIRERRVSGQLTRTYFRADSTGTISGSRAADAGQTIPDSYWYAVGRDEALEHELARRIRERM